MASNRSSLPSWLVEPEHYRPGTDRDDFISRNLESIASKLALFRLDDGTSSSFSPSPPIKLVLGMACILMTSLSRNYLFTLVMLAIVLLRACFLNVRALERVAAGALAAAALTFVVMLPAVFMGQPQSALLLGTKALVSTGIALTVALTTPQAQLTGALRSFGIPSLVILTVDLALRSIVSLGETATKALTALRMRSVGLNDRKQASLGGIGGVVLVRASRNAHDTLDAMRCRGFDGTYEGPRRQGLRGIDTCWVLGCLALLILFLYLQEVI